MKKDGFTAQKRVNGGALPTSRAAGGRLSMGRRIQKTFNNIKITILCGFVTILVLRVTIRVGNLGSSDADAVNQHLIEETNRILEEIRSDSDDPTENELINLSVQCAKFEETRRMNAHAMRKDMMDYEIASDVLAATKQAAEAAKSGC
ncbi:hypothetical protein QQ045_021245 [Rhodiola kirilowii]